jgi:hypothetical protein
MKALLVFVLATVVATSLALNEDPIDAIPYCRVVSNGFTTDSLGVEFDVAQHICQDYVAIAIFHNGQDTGFNLTFALESDDHTGFYAASGENTTFNNPPPLGVVFDFGTEDCEGGLGITDGTYDTVDGAMSIIFDGSAYGGSSDNSNLTSTCSPTTVAFSLGSDVLPKNLTMKRTFYFPSASSEAWGRVVDGVHNPTADAIEVSIGYFNNVGSDSNTIFFNVTARFSFSGDSANSSELTDNLVSFHWSSWNATVPDGFISRNEPVPLADGNDDIMPYWNVTIPAGETMTFMFIMNQGGYDMTEMYSSVKDIDANPLKLYTDMTDEQLSTLYNFNACTSTLPQLTSLTPSTACAASGGETEFDLTAYLNWAPAETTVTAHGSDGAVVATSEGNSISVPAGTYSVKITYGNCAAKTVGELTVTCPDAPTTTNSPTAATSSASIVGSAAMLIVSSLLV